VLPFWPEHFVASSKKPSKRLAAARLAPIRVRRREVAFAFSVWRGTSSRSRRTLVDGDYRSGSDRESGTDAGEGPAERGGVAGEWLPMIRIINIMELKYQYL
jgi:hypothetical protein